MMLKAFLAWAGIMAVRTPTAKRHQRQAPHPRNDAFHDEANREQAIFAGAQAVVRQSHRLADAMASDPTNLPRINKGLTDMRSTIAETARRADR